MNDKQLSPRDKEQQAALTVHGNKEVQLGGLFLSKDGEFYEVTDIRQVEKEKEWLVELSYTRKGELRSYGEHSARYWIERNDYIYLGLPPDGMTKAQYQTNLLDEALDAIRNPGALAHDSDTPDNSTSALSISYGPDKYKSLIQTIEDKQLAAKTVEALIKSRVQEVSFMVREMATQIKKLKRIVGVLELYLGFEEEIIQITEGPSAPSDMPISIRQLVLFMDEEVGDPKEDNLGIDYKRIDDFDEWVRNNYGQCIPESKGIVAIRPSRQKRPYINQLGWEVFDVQPEDARIYLLIRNGSNLYRIYTQLAGIERYFIPSEKELLSILNEIDEGWGSSKDKAENAQLYYSRNALLVQGLIDRTDLLNPYDHRPDVLSGTDSLVNFIYDGGEMLPDGKLPFKEWKAQINSKIKKGTRIVVGNNINYELHYRASVKDRFLRYYRDRAFAPPAPKPGIYNVEEMLPEDHRKLKYRKNKIAFIIRYNPKDEVYADWYRDWHERKNRLSFILYADDPFVINYDLVDLEAIDFYEKSRVERPNYLDIIPVLWEMKWNRREEIKREKSFVGLIASEMACGESEVWQAVEWWKRRVQMVRPLDKDDAKAWRMIKRHLRGAWQNERI